MTREEAIKELTELLPEEFLMEYADAIKMAIDTLASNSKNVLVVQGGPGTGKTTIINCIVRLLLDIYQIKHIKAHL